MRGAGWGVVLFAYRALLTDPWVVVGTIRGRTPSAFYVPGCLTVQIEEADRGAEQQRMAAGVRVGGDGG